MRFLANVNNFTHLVVIPAQAGIFLSNLKIDFGFMTGKGGYVYIVSNKARTVLYIGVTSNLFARIAEHKAGTGSRFTSMYKCVDLLYYEFFSDIESAIQREKAMKKWNRSWKDKLISPFNSELTDLYSTIEEMQ